MGMLNPRVRCPNCGGKIHTYRDRSVIGTPEQPWGRLTAQKTGAQCQLCAVPLTGRIVGRFGEIAAVEEDFVAPVSEPHPTKELPKEFPAGPSPEGNAKRGRTLIAEHGDATTALKATHPDLGGDISDFEAVQAARAEAGRGR